MATGQLEAAGRRWSCSDTRSFIMVSDRQKKKEKRIGADTLPKNTDDSMGY
jgi:hypothetical protein